MQMSVCTEDYESMKRKTINLNQIKMRTFLKNLGITALSIFIVVSFIRFDINISTWNVEGRVSFVFFTLLISCLATALEKIDN